MDSKASLTRIIAAHRATYYNLRTRRRQVADHVRFEALPLGIAALCLGAGVDLSPALAAALGGLAALLAGMSFAAFLFTGSLAARLATQLAAVGADGRETSSRRTFLEEVIANTAYATLAALACLAAFAVGFGPWELWRADGIALGLAAHTFLVFAMVMKRLVALSQRNLLDTLADREPASPAEPVA